MCLYFSLIFPLRIVCLLLNVKTAAFWELHTFCETAYATVVIVKLMGFHLRYMCIRL